MLEKNVLKVGKGLGLENHTEMVLPTQSCKRQINEKPIVSVIPIRTRESQEQPIKSHKNRLLSRKRAVAEATMLEDMV